MNDPLANVTKGDPLVITADTANAWTEAARYARRNKHNGGIGDTSDMLVPSLKLLIKNNTAADLDSFSVLRVTDWSISPVTYPYEVLGKPIVAGATPNAASNLVVITTEPIADGSYGEAVLCGAAVVDVLVNDTGHTYAEPINGDNTKLSSATSGPARILAWESSGSTRRAIVSLGDGTNAGGSFTLAGRTGSQTIASGDTLTLNNGVVTATDTWTPDVASASLAGIVDTGTQTFAGEKSFKDQVRINTALDHGYPNLTVYSNGVDSISTLIGDGIRIAENGSAIGGADEWMDLYFASATKFELNLQNASGPSTSTLLSIYRGDAFYGYAFQFTSSTGTADLWVGGNKGATGTSGGGDTVTSGLITTLGTPITTEVIQDAVGSILVSSSRISATYDDGVPSITHDLILDTITADYLHATQTEILFGRSTAGAGGGEEITMGTSMAIVGGVLDVDVVDGGTF